MSESEWNKSHPKQCESYIEAWKTKDSRERARVAAIQHIIAVSGGVKIQGRSARFEDFYQTEKKKRTPKQEKQFQEFQTNVARRKAEIEKEKANGKK